MGGAAMGGGASWLAAVVCSLLGVGLGWHGRLLLARIPRGALLRARHLELAGAVTGGISGFLLWPSVLIAPALWASALMVVLSAVDLKHHRLPDAITLPSIAVTTALLILTQLIDSASGSLVRAAIAATVLGGFFFGTAALTPAAMGRGDAKLVLSLGLLLGYLSWSAVIIGIAAAFVLGGFAGLIGILVGRMKLRSALPFGPFLVFATWLMLLWPELPQFLAG